MTFGKPWISAGLKGVTPSNALAWELLPRKGSWCLACWARGVWRVAVLVVGIEGLGVVGDPLEPSVRTTLAVLTE